MSLLQQPLTLANGKTLKNRLFKAAMSEQLARKNAPTEAYATLYGRWAQGGAGVLVTGNVMVDYRALGAPNDVVIEDGRDLPALRRWAEAGTQDGTLLHPRKIPTTECPVLFDAPLAAGLLGAFVHAVSGGALYRKSTFLLDSMGQQVFPAHLHIDEDPFVLRGKGSSPFDAEGVAVRARRVVDAGTVQGYFLSSYTARKLGMPVTGHAGGSHNLTLHSNLTRASDDLPAMLQKLGTGLFVIELMGHGLNAVTGDYSRGASGFWVENGQIAFPVHEITIAGNMRDMFMGIEAVGADAYNYGAKTTGSILINRMTVAGS